MSLGRAVNHFIERETRGGFHTSFGRGDPCTQCEETDAGFALLELVKGWGARVRLFFLVSF
jgi:hypothetical protein